MLETIQRIVNAYNPLGGSSGADGKQGEVSQINSRVAEWPRVLAPY